jgi:hypothetical protein
MKIIILLFVLLFANKAYCCSEFFESLQQRLATARNPQLERSEEKELLKIIHDTRSEIQELILGSYAVWFQLRKILEKAHQDNYKEKGRRFIQIYKVGSEKMKARMAENKQLIEEIIASQDPPKKKLIKAKIRIDFITSVLDMSELSTRYIWLKQQQIAAAYFLAGFHLRQALSLVNNHKAVSLAKQALLETEALRIMERMAVDIYPDNDVPFFKLIRKLLKTELNRINLQYANERFRAVDRPPPEPTPIPELDKALQVLDEQEKFIIKHYYGIDVPQKTQAQIAKMLHVSRATIYNRTITAHEKIAREWQRLQSME